MEDLCAKRTRKAREHLRARTYGWTRIGQYARLLDPLWRVEMALWRYHNYGSAQLGLTSLTHAGDLCSVSTPLTAVWLT